MKTRIHDQYLRFRLDESDVEALCERGHVEQKIMIGVSAVAFQLSTGSGSPSATLTDGQLHPLAG